MGKQNENDNISEIDTNDYDTVTLYLDDGAELECLVLCVYEAMEKQYIALLPINDEEDNDVIFYRYSEDENGEPIIDNIDTEDEYEIAEDAFDELLDEEEFDESDIEE